MRLYTVPPFNPLLLTLSPMFYPLWTLYASALQLKLPTALLSLPSNKEFCRLKIEQIQKKNVILQKRLEAKRELFAVFRNISNSLLWMYAPRHCPGIIGTAHQRKWDLCLREAPAGELLRQALTWPFMLTRLCTWEHHYHLTPAPSTRDVCRRLLLSPQKSSRLFPSGIGPMRHLSPIQIRLEYIEILWR